MNDDKFKLPDGPHLLGILGGLRPQAGVDEEPALTLSVWRAFQVPSGAIHLIGHCNELVEGRATSHVVAGNAATRRCVTSSGRQYTLQGRSGTDGDAAWVWDRFKRINGLVDEVDISDRLFDLLPPIGSAV